MKPSFVRGPVVRCVTFFLFVSGLCAQTAPTPNPNGYPQDWSSQNIIFSRNGLAQHPDLVYKEPRVMQQVLRHSQLPNYGALEISDTMSPTGGLVAATRSAAEPVQKAAHDRDWAFALQGHVVIDAFPAKFGFYPNTPPSCTGDFVVFGLTNSNNANLVGLNNLYSNTVTGGGFCDPVTGPGTGPTVLFAYNITTVPGGHITTSPILSFDGTKVAFVESIPTNMGLGVTAQCVFHVVPTNGGGTLTTPTPLPGFTLVLSPTVNDTHSSPWIDYINDVVYVGTDDGFIHKITGVFKGVPTLDPPGSNFPVAAGVLHPTSPVLDEGLGKLMVGSADGNLYQIDITTGAENALAIGSGPGSGIAAPPVVDVIDGTTFAVTADDGIAAAMVEARTITDVAISTAELGLGNSNGVVIPPLNIFQPVFSNSYYNDPSSGIITVCGTAVANTSPYQYVFGFTGDTMHEMPLFKQQLSTSVDARCTGWSEIFNPNIGGGTDYFFFGLTQDCTSITGDSTSGCVAEETNLSPTSFDTSPVEVTINGGPSGIIFDNYVDPTVYPEASSIYFTGLKINDAYKLTQNGLQ